MPSHSPIACAARRAPIAPGRSIACSAWRLAAPPKADETTLAKRLLDRRVQKGADSLQSLCLVVLNLNEFIYVD